MTGDNKSHKRCFVVGITGPSGSGKSTLTQCLADQLSGFLVSEDPKFFLAPAAASYEHRDPMSETPSHVDWDAYITHLTSEIANCNTRILLVEHFLLLHDARVVQELDGILFLDTFGSWQLCRDRRIQRNPHRTDSEIHHLSHYYENHVWPNYQLYCEAPARKYCLEQHPESSYSKVLDCRASLKEMVDQALQAIRQWSE